MVHWQYYRSAGRKGRHARAPGRQVIQARRPLVAWLVAALPSRHFWYCSIFATRLFELLKFHHEHASRVFV